MHAICCAPSIAHCTQPAHGNKFVTAGQAGARRISVDSVMVYRGLDIGAAKPTADEQAIAPPSGGAAAAAVVVVLGAPTPNPNPNPNPH